MKESWKTINELRNKRSKSSNTDCLKDSNKEIVYRSNISNAKKGFFCSVGKDLAERIYQIPKPLLSGNYETNTNSADFHFEFQHTTFPCIYN